MKWILIVVALSSMNMSGATMSGHGTGSQIAMQEFNTVEACQFASLEVQRLVLGLKMVCVPKGVMVGSNEKVSAHETQ